MRYKSKNYLHGDFSDIFTTTSEKLGSLYERLSDVADDFLFDRRGNVFLATCLSGKDSGQNEGQGIQPADSRWVESNIEGSSNIGKKLQIKVRRIGVEDEFLVNPFDGSLTKETAMKVLEMHPWAISEEIFESSTTEALKHGDIVKVIEEQDGTLTWIKATKEEAESAYLNKFKTPSDISLDSLFTSADIESYNFGSPGNLGNYTQPCPKCQRGVYIGFFEEFHDQEVLNGQVPKELLGRATVGFIKPILLKEIVPYYDQLARAFQQRFKGNDIGAEGNRSFASQVKTKARWVAKKDKNGKSLGHFAATPGTSKHGWAVAFDWRDKKGNRHKKGFDSDEYKWMLENAPKYGFHNPKWAQRGGRPEEPWHFEWIEFSNIIKR